MAEFSMDKMAKKCAEKAMEELRDNGVFDEDLISRKHLLSEIDDLMKSPWFNQYKNDIAVLHFGYVERKEAVEIVRDLCVKAEPSVAPKPETVTEFADRCRECGVKYGKLIKQEVCEDAVSREAVKSALCELCGLYGDEKGCPFINGDCDDLNAINALPPVTSKQRLCKDCKFFEYDHIENVNGIPLIVAHEICNKWGNGCRTSEDGYCFLFEPKMEGESE